MTHILSTTLLGKERAQPTVPYDNIRGNLAAQGGSLTFSPDGSNKAIWTTAFENIQDFGWDTAEWRYDAVHKITSIFGKALTLGLFNASQYLYIWVLYHEERVGKVLGVRFLVSDGWCDEEKGNRLVRTIGEEIASYRDGIRSATRPR